MERFNVFFSNRSVDQERVNAIQEKLRTLLPNLPFDDVSKSVPYEDDWKIPAQSVLKTCDALVCIVGPETHRSEPVDWELREANDHGKPLLVARISPDCQLPPCCEELGISGVSSDVSSLAGQIAELLVSRALFLKHDWSSGNPNQEMVWNQYDLMVQSWEALIARRQTVNTLYVSATAALLAGVGVIVTSVDKVGFNGAIAGTFLLGFLGSALSLNWRRTVMSYGTLSKAKAKVIGALESFLPAQLFDAEWRVLEANRYRSTTETDMQTSQFFLLLFVTTGVVAFGCMIGNLF